MLKSKCPAYGKKCLKCGEMNHFSHKCPKNRKKVHLVDEESDDSELELLHQKDQNMKAV